MRTRGAALAAAAAATAVGLVVVGMSVGQAQTQTGAGAGAGDGNGNGNKFGQQTTATSMHGSGAGSGGQRARSGPGSAGQRGGYGPGSGTVVTASLTSAQRADLLAMVEEEKLSGDVYAILADQYDDATLARIAASEDKHADALRRLMSRYEIADPTVGLAAGEFATAEFQALYDQFVARGATSLAAAYDVGADIERLDIDDLTVAIAAASDRSDIVRVYTNLRTASSRHLDAFTA